MRVLLTGASSFTGYWFAAALKAAGHEVVAPLQAARDSYRDGMRAERVRRLGEVATVVEAAPFGTDAFFSIVNDGHFDVLCHHAALVGDYRNPDFDVAGALASNTRNFRKVLVAMGERGLRGVVLTGSVFEQDEGVGEAPLRAFSLYGMSKTLTAQLVANQCQTAGVPFGKFVIPNPFGPLEEPRFCAYLLRTWRAAQVAGVNTPAYVRDNIHVRLLADAYARFVGETKDAGAVRRLNPAGYIESQGAFAQRFAREMGPRLGLEAKLSLANQTVFEEPVMRVNTQKADLYVPFDETAAWDEYARMV